MSTEAIFAELALERQVEALLFAAAEPLSLQDLEARLGETADVAGALASLTIRYADRGVQLQCVAGRWRFATAPDLAHLLEHRREEPRRLSRAAMETLAVIAYHQPVTRAEVDAIRGVSLSRGALDVLLEVGWVRMRGRRRSPGRPVTYGVTDAFLEHFGLPSPGRPARPGRDEDRRLAEPGPAGGLQRTGPRQGGRGRRPAGGRRSAGIRAGLPGR